MEMEAEVSERRLIHDERAREEEARYKHQLTALTAERTRLSALVAEHRRLRVERRQEDADDAADDDEDDGLKPTPSRHKRRTARRDAGAAAAAAAGTGTAARAADAGMGVDGQTTEEEAMLADVERRLALLTNPMDHRFDEEAVRGEIRRCASHATRRTHSLV